METSRKGVDTRVYEGSRCSWWAPLGDKCLSAAHQVRVASIGFLNDERCFGDIREDTQGSVTLSDQVFPGVQRVIVYQLLKAADASVSKNLGLTPSPTSGSCHLPTTLTDNHLEQSVSKSKSLYLEPKVAIIMQPPAASHMTCP